MYYKKITKFSFIKQIISPYTAEQIRIIIVHRITIDTVQNTVLLKKKKKTLALNSHQ